MYLNTKVITRPRGLHREVYTAEQNTTPQAEDRGLIYLEEVFIKEFFIF
jgi:hypothetical protein